VLIDTHCHINIIVKNEFDRPLTADEISAAQTIINNARDVGVSIIINVGTNVIESENCYKLAEKYDTCFAAVGIHPTDATHDWKNDIKKLHAMIQKDARKKIVAVGECGIDRYHKGYNAQLQEDVFKAQIELALEHNLALSIHSRDAADETLDILLPYKGQLQQAVMHCFSYDQAIASEVVDNFGFFIGIDAPITYPKNEILRSVVNTMPLEAMVLETDAPFLPPQQLRGKQNSPEHIATIANFMADLRGQPFEAVAAITTANAKRLFRL
jgi:TatD DNase family protein